MFFGLFVFFCVFISYAAKARMSESYLHNVRWTCCFWGGLFFYVFFVAAAAARLALKKFVALVRSRKPFRAFGHNLSVAIVARSQMELSEEIASPKKRTLWDTGGM